MQLRRNLKNKLTGISQDTRLPKLVSLGIPYILKTILKGKMLKIVNIKSTLYYFPSSLFLFFSSTSSLEKIPLRRGKDDTFGEKIEFHLQKKEMKDLINIWKLEDEAKELFRKIKKFIKHNKERGRAGRKGFHDQIENSIRIWKSQRKEI